MIPTLQIRSAGRSERGPRARNEDRFLRRESGDVGVYAVADGLGGVAGGQVAANRAVQLLSERLDSIERAVRRGDPSGPMAAILVEIDADLKRLGEADPVLTGLGTTLTLATLAPGRLSFAHSGDSRLWVAGDGVPFRRLSEDMNLAARLLREGRIGESEYASSPHRARLLSYLGKGSVRPQCGSLPLAGRTAIVLATDGLTGPLSEADVAAALDPALDPDDVASPLMRLALARGVNDNVTVVAASLALPFGATDDPFPKDFESCGSAGSD
jgi:protein phosphatase